MKKILSLLLILLFLPAILGENETNSTNSTTQISGNVTFTPGTDTILWVLYFVLLMCGMIYAESTPGVAVFFMMYAIVFGLLTAPLLSFWITLFLVGAGLLVGGVGITRILEE